MYEEEGPNTTDVDASLQQLKDNDAKLKELNLNNIKVAECWACDALFGNVQLVHAWTACLLRIRKSILSSFWECCSWHRLR